MEVPSLRNDVMRDRAWPAFPGERDLLGLWRAGGSILFSCFVTFDKYLHIFSNNFSFDLKTIVDYSLINASVF